MTKKTLKIVVTGSIGMGKSTVSKMFGEFGAKIWSADGSVKALYAADQDLHDFIRGYSEDLIVNNAVNFDLWRKYVREDQSLLPKLEAIIHPKIRQDRNRFLEGEGILLCEIPLYFETSGDDDFDYVVVVSAPPEVQRARVLERGTMSEEDFEFILKRQVPDAEKRKRADVVIETGKSLDETRGDVRSFLEKIGAI